MSDIPYGYCQCGCGQRTTISKHTSTKHGRVKGKPTPYLSGHSKHVPVTDYAVNAETGCWLWLRHIDEYGTPRLYKSENPSTLAQRVYYERAYGPLAANQRIENTCQNRHCVNPAHMAVRTRLDDFWALVDKNAPNGCWHWTGTLLHSGYGVIQYEERTWRAHQLAYTLLVGSIPDGLCALHRCDNRRCVNPDHIFLGTKGDNARDMVQKQRSLLGERNHKAKLTADDVQEIRRLYAEGGVTQDELGRRFGVRQDQVSRIVLGKEWRHV